MKNKVVDKIIMNSGAMFFLLGAGGLGAACEGQGSFLISAIIFSIGIGMCWKTMKEGTEWEE